MPSTSAVVDGSSPSGLCSCLLLPAAKDGSKINQPAAKSDRDWIGIGDRAWAALRVRVLHIQRSCGHRDTGGSFR